MTLLNCFGVSALQRRSQRIAHQHLWNTFILIPGSYRNLPFLPLSWLMVGGRVRKRRCLGEGPMTGWLWQPGRGTPKLYNTPTPQIGADRCMQKSLSVGTFLNRSLPSIGRG